MSYRCNTCGETHSERPTCFGAEMPAVVSRLSDEERGRRVSMSSDQCVLDDEHFFVLGTLDLPVHGSGEAITWIVWSTLSKANFQRMSELWNTEGRESEPPYFGRLSNQIPGFPDSLNLKLRVRTEPLGLRPKFEVVDDGHPLRSVQQDGITDEQADHLIHAALYGAVNRP